MPHEPPSNQRFAAGGRARLEGTCGRVAASGDRRTGEALCLGQSRVCSLAFPGFWPEDVTVTVTSGPQAVTEAAHLKYETSRPNGRCCPPTCHTASINIVL